MFELYPEIVSPDQLCKSCQVPNQFLSSIVLRTNNRMIEMRLFILYNLQFEIINFLYKNYRKAAS